MRTRCSSPLAMHSTVLSGKLYWTWIEVKSIRNLGLGAEEGCALSAKEVMLDA